MDEKQQDEWIAEDWGDVDGDDWVVTHPALIDADHRVTVYLAGEAFNEQRERLVRLLNRVAPDGVLPDDEVSS